MEKRRRAIFAAIIAASLVMVNSTTLLAQEQEEQLTEVQEDAIYQLGSGDKLKITVYGEEELSGEFEIDGAGILSMPLLGNIKTAGLDVRALEHMLVEKFKEGYLVDPRVNIEILNFRPFFILGEVKEPGSYPYVNGLTVVNAIALSGGYTYRARTDRVIIQRGKGNQKKEFEAHEEDLVLPGDTLRITERFF